MGCLTVSISFWFCFCLHIEFNYRNVFFVLGLRGRELPEYNPLAILLIDSGTRDVDVVKGFCNFMNTYINYDKWAVD